MVRLQYHARRCSQKNICRLAFTAERKSNRHNISALILFARLEKRAMIN